MKRLLKHWPLAVASAIAFSGKAHVGLVYTQETFRAPKWYIWLMWLAVVYGGMVIIGYTRARKYWPVWLAVISVGLNTDLMILHFQTQFRLERDSLLWVFVSIGGLSTLKIYYSYWFYGWLAKMVVNIESVRDISDFAREIGVELKSNGYIARIRNFVAEKLNIRTYQNSRVIKLVKAGGYLPMLGFGVYPLSGTRGPTVILCRILGYFSGLCVLAVGNLIRVGYLLGGIQFFKSLLQ